MTTHSRDWSALHGPAARIALVPERDDRMQAFVRMVWGALSQTGISWVGFYTDNTGNPDTERLTLAAREPKPACSPIGIHGACGRSLLAGEPFLVDDVRDLGAAYIACDPRDRSELVVPCSAPDGTVWGVLDFDSHEIRSFSTQDAHEVVYLLKLAGLSASGC